MLDRENQQSIAVGYCYGTDKKDPIIPPKLFRVSSDGERLSVGCPLFSTGARCERTQEICIWTSATAEQVNDPDPVKKAILPGGRELVFDSEADLVLKSPNLPKGHNPVDLTATEAIILGALVTSQGSILSREALSRAYTGSSYFDPRLDRGTVNTHIGRLRGKIGDNRSDTDLIIVTIKSKGYMIPSAPKPT